MKLLPRETHAKMHVQSISLSHHHHDTDLRPRYARAMMRLLTVERPTG